MPNSRGRPHRGAGALSLWALVSLAACVPPSTVGGVGPYAARAARADSLAHLAVTQEQAIAVASIPQNTLSVAPLGVLSADTTYASLGYGMAALLITDLSRSARLTLVERLKIDATLRELELAQSGRVDTATAPRVGRLVGARQIVVGTVDLRSGNSLRIDSYIANAVTGRVSSPVNGSATLSGLFDAEKAMAFRLFDRLGITLSPAERRAVEQRATGSLVAFLAFSRGARAEAFGNFAAAAANYAEALRLDAKFAAANERLTALQGAVAASLNTTTFLTRAASISTDLVNRPSSALIGTGVDIPATSRQQLITFTIVVRTP